MQRVIEAKNVSKTYGDKYAVENLSLQINKGDIYGLIGLNGAGKTTLIRLLLGLIRPSKGMCQLNGELVTLKNHSLWHQVGYIVEAPHAYSELTVWENLDIFRRIHSIRNLSAIEQVIHLLNLEKYSDVKVKHLSLGNKQRLGIAKAILHEPSILILDEPVNGLDPKGIVDVRNLLKKLAEENGVTILLSSHILEEITKIVSKIGIIDNGLLIKELSTSDLHGQLNKTLHVDSTNRRLLKAKLIHYGYKITENIDGSFTTDHPFAIKHPERIAQLMANEKVPLTKLLLHEETLEQYFLRTIQKGERK